MIQIHDILVLSQQPFVDRQVRSALADPGRPARLRRLIGRLRGVV